MKTTVSPSRRNDWNWRRNPNAKRTSKRDCAWRGDDKNITDHQGNNTNPNKQSIIHLWGNQRRRTYQSRTRLGPGIQSNQKETNMRRTPLAKWPDTKASPRQWKQTNSQRWHPNAEILRGMRTSHTSSKTNPWSLDYRISESNPWTDGKTSRNHENDPRMQIKVLVPWISKKNQTMGTTMRKLHQIQKNQQSPN